MNHLLIVAATQAEIAPIMELAQATELETDSQVFVSKTRPNLRFLITGVGIPATVFHLSRYLSQYPCDLCLNAGIAGAFPDSGLRPGDVVEVSQDCFGDLGVDDRGRFCSLFELNFQNPNIFPYTGGKLNNTTIQELSPPLKSVSGITVNLVAGSRPIIDARIKAHSAQTETMEGAGVAYVCLMNNTRFIQIRSISNIIEERNRDTWNIELSIRELNKYIEFCLKKSFSVFLC